MKLCFAVFVAAASAAEWPNVNTTYTESNCEWWDGACQSTQAEIQCGEAEAALMASENYSTNKTVESLPYLKECGEKCKDFQNVAINGGSETQRCWSKDEITVADYVRTESCSCFGSYPYSWVFDKSTYPFGTPAEISAQGIATKGSLTNNYLCLVGHGIPMMVSDQVTCDIRSLEAIYKTLSGEEACEEAHDNLFGTLGDNLHQTLDNQAECESACAKFDDETRCFNDTQKACIEAQVNLFDSNYTSLDLRAECDSACAEYEETWWGSCLSEARQACVNAQDRLWKNTDHYDTWQLTNECEDACEEFEDESCDEEDETTDEEAADEEATDEEATDEEACAEAQANLAASDPDDFFGNLGLQAACEEACSELGETCGFLVNGISFALLALLAFLRN